MKKTLALILALCSAVTVLASCGNENQPDNPPEQKVYEFTPESIPAENVNPRQIVVDYMRSMSQVEWTPSKKLDLTSISKSLLYSKGKTYRGLPYTTTRGENLEIFSNYLNENNEYTGPTDPKEVPGNHCTSSIYHAWRQVSPTVTCAFSHNFLPTKGMGAIKLGDYDITAKDDLTEDVTKRNGSKKMCECYALLQPGDVILETVPGTGHARMVVENHVEYDVSGTKINASRSYVITLEQTNAMEATKDNPNIMTNWFVDHKYTYSKLYSDHYITLTLQELSATDAPEIKVHNYYDADTLLNNKTKGIFYSNYPLQAITLTVSDEDGNVVKEKTVNPKGVLTYSMTPNDKFENFDDLESGKKYLFKVNVKIPYGDADCYGFWFDVPAETKGE